MYRVSRIRRRSRECVGLFSSHPISSGHISSRLVLHWHIIQLIAYVMLPCRAAPLRADVYPQYLIPISITSKPHIPRALVSLNVFSYSVVPIENLIAPFLFLFFVLSLILRFLCLLVLHIFLISSLKPRLSRTFFRGVYLFIHTSIPSACDFSILPFLPPLPVLILPSFSLIEIALQFFPLVPPLTPGNPCIISNVLCSLFPPGTFPRRVILSFPPVLASWVGGGA